MMLGACEKGRPRSIPCTDLMSEAFHNMHPADDDPVRVKHGPDPKLQWLSRLCSTKLKDGAVKECRNCLHKGPGDYANVSKAEDVSGLKWRKTLNRMREGRENLTRANVSAKAHARTGRAKSGRNKLTNAPEPVAAKQNPSNTNQKLARGSTDAKGVDADSEDSIDHARGGKARVGTDRMDRETRDVLDPQALRRLPNSVGRLARQRLR